MIKRINNNFRLIIFIIITASIVSPYISIFYHGYVGYIPLVIISLLFVVNSSFGKHAIKEIKRLYRINKRMFISLLWFIFGIGFSYLRGANDIGYIIVISLLPLFFFFGLFLSVNKRYHSLVVLSIFVFALINIIFTGIQVSVNESARALVEINDQTGIGTTGFWGILGIFLPVFFLEYYNIKKPLYKIIFVFTLFYMFYKLIFSGYATPVGLFLINLVLIGLLNLIFRTRLKNFFKTVVISVFFIAISLVLLNSILKSQAYGTKAIQYRFLNFIANPASGGYKGNTAISRVYLMGVSLNTIKKHPLFGGGGNIRTSMYQGEIAGGHSSAFDFLAVLGILGGGGAFLYFVYKATKNSYSHLKNEKNLQNIVYFSTVLTFIIGGIMNPYWQGPILATFLLIVNIYKQP